MFKKKMNQPILTVQRLDDDNEEDFTPDIKNSFENFNIQNHQTPVKDASQESSIDGKSAETLLTRKKLNIMSSNYQPNKTFK